MIVRAIARSAAAVVVLVAVILLLFPDYLPRFPPPYDKIMHIGAFAVTTIFFWFSVRRTRHRIVLVAFLVLCGAGIELYQYGLPGRHPEFNDALANVVGISIAIAFSWLITGTEMFRTSAAKNSIRNAVVNAYLEAQSAERPIEECLEAAMDAYRRLDPDSPERDARVRISRWVEDISVS